MVLFLSSYSVAHDTLHTRLGGGTPHSGFSSEFICILGLFLRGRFLYLLREDTPLPWWLGSAFAPALRSYSTAFTFLFRILA